MNLGAKAAEDDERLTVARVAEELEISPKTVRRLIGRGELVAHRLTPKRIFVFRRDLDSFIETRPRVTTAVRR